MEKKIFNAEEFVKAKKETFFESIFSNKLEDLTFVVDITQGKKGYTALSKTDQSRYVYPIEGLMQKLKSIYKDMNDDHSISFEKGDFSKIIDGIPNVEGIVTDFSKKPGIYKNNGARYYNHWNKSTMMRDIDTFNEGRATIDYTDLNWDSYKHISFLINHLLNVDENPAIDINKNVVDLKKHFINWLAYCLQNNEKTGMYYLFVSPTQGTGKSMFTNIIKDFYGMDYYAEANKDTFLSTHNKMVDGKLFVCLNEIAIETRDYDMFASKLKVLITESDIIIRAMYKDQVMQKSYSNTIINSNQIVPYKIEDSDRRANVVRAPTDGLKVVVEREMKISIQEFHENVQLETFLFLCDILNINTNKKEATYNCLTTEAKKIIIRATNTQAMNVMSLMEKNDQDGLRDYFSECDNEHLFEDFLHQVNSRFLTNDVVNNFLHVNLREDMGQGSKMSKKIFWDRRLGSASNVPYTTKEGKKTSISVRKLSGFKTPMIQDYFTPAGFDKEFYEEVENTFDYDDTSFFDKEDGI